MIKNCQLPTLFGNFNQSISPDFQDEKKILLVDLASAEKIIATIREEKLKKTFLKAKYFRNIRNNQSFKHNCTIFDHDGQLALSTHF